MFSTRNSRFAPTVNRFRTRCLARMVAAVVACAVVSVAHAQIIYVSKNASLSSSLFLDFDSNNVADIFLNGRAVSNGAGFKHTTGSQTGQVVLTGSVLDKLAFGETISSSSTWSNMVTNGGVAFASSDWGSPGASNTGYVGISFVSGSSTYYGWAEITYSSSIGGTLIGYAYNTVAGGGITAGQTVSAIPEPATTAACVGALALLGAVWWRKNRSRRAETVPDLSTATE